MSAAKRPTVDDIPGIPVPQPQPSAPRTLASFERRDVRTAMARVLNR